MENKQKEKKEPTLPTEPKQENIFSLEAEELSATNICRSGASEPVESKLVEEEQSQK